MAFTTRGLLPVNSACSTMLVEMSEAVKSVSAPQQRMESVMYWICAQKSIIILTLVQAATRTFSRPSVAGAFVPRIIPPKNMQPTMVPVLVALGLGRPFLAMKLFLR
jgi:hypothetical protein